MAQQKGSLPHYLAIKNELERRIISGQLKAGDRFPSEEELSQEFNVSTSTVKRAIGVLVADGLVERTPGRGTFVRVSRVRNPLRSFTEEMRSRGLMPSSQLIAQEKTKVRESWPGIFRYRKKVKCIISPGCAWRQHPCGGGSHLHSRRPLS